MKLNRTHIFIAISSLALVVVLIIQVNWILQTAKIKEDLFNEKANIVLSRTVEALGSDKETSMNIASCVRRDSASNEPAVKLGKNEVRKIDSVFAHYMVLYNFRIDYTYMISKPSVLASINETGFTNYIYDKRLDNLVSEDRVELKLIFPEKQQYIIAEMGPMFITSVILILIVLVMFWRTVSSLMKEKQISEHTAEFLNNMTHEFKTPLTNIALAGKMIIKDSMIRQDDKVKHYSEIILEENDKLRLQVEQVLSMTALERGEVPIQKTTLDFHQLIDNALKCMSIQIENRQGYVNLNLNANRFVIMGDRIHLTNALCNLIDNAIKYSGNEPHLSIQTSNNDQLLTIAMYDQGIGIEKEYHNKVFDKFFRVPTGDVHDVKGFGLGLAYVKKIIELHAGTIDLQSVKGKGTSFTITIPHA